MIEISLTVQDYYLREVFNLRFVFGILNGV